jgi:hypothetical protein
MPSASSSHRTACPLSAATRALLALEVRPGSWRLEFSASWLNDTESGTICRAAAYFWCEWDPILSPCCDMEEVREELLSDWNEAEDGPLPELDSPEMDLNLEGDENEAVRQDVEIALPRAMFVAITGAGETPRSGSGGGGGGGGASAETVSAPEPEVGSDEQPEGEGSSGTVTIKLEEVASWAMEVAAAAEISAARQRLAWAAAAAADVPAASVVGLLSLDLIERVGVTHCAAAAKGEQQLCVVSDCDTSDHFFPPPSPCTWEYCIGWKGSSGTAELEVAAPTGHSQQQMTTAAAPTRTLTLGEVLVRQLSGSIGFIDGSWFCKDIELGGDWVEWEEWRSKCADMVVTPPVMRTLTVAEAAEVAELAQLPLEDLKAEAARAGLGARPDAADTVGAKEALAQMVVFQKRAEAGA